jgi:hypothetical protein
MSTTNTTTSDKKNQASNAVAAGGGRTPEQNQMLKDAGISDADIAEMNARSAKAAASYEDRTSDVAGFWEAGLSDFHGVPENVKLFDSILNPEKPSCLVTAKVESPCIISTSEETADGKKKLRPSLPGEKVGIWTKPGMRDMVLCGGVSTRISFSGTKDVHKKKGFNPMKMFTVTSEKGGVRIPIIEDRREKSKNTPTIFDVNGAADDDI